MRLLLFAFICLSTTSYGQWKEFKLSPRGDTLNRVDMKGLKQGPWVISMPELRGEQGYDEQGYFINDKKDGLWKRFSLMGDKIAEENFRWGALDGRAKYFNRTGALIRLESWRAVDPEKTMDTVDVMDIKDPSKMIDRVVVKLEGKTMKHGVWTYYNPEWGEVEKTENYFMDKLRTGEGMPGEGEDDLKPINVSSGAKTDSTGKKVMVKPQAILDFEKKNAGKKKIKARDGSTGN